jgi:hypothetical protein
MAIWYSSELWRQQLTQAPRASRRAQGSRNSQDVSRVVEWRSWPSAEPTGAMGGVLTDAGVCQYPIV